MPAWVTSLLIAIASAIVAASLGYRYRRSEHLRDERFAACSEMVGAFHEAAGTGADLLSIHVQTGFPYKLSEKTWTEAQRREMTDAWKEAMRAASTARARFDVADLRLRLVASAELRDAGKDLRQFLQTSLYDGEPWNLQRDYPSATRNPNEIQPAAFEAAQPFIERAASAMWRRAVPKPPS